MYSAFAINVADKRSRQGMRKTLMRPDNLVAKMNRKQRRAKRDESKSDAGHYKRMSHHSSAWGGK